MLKLCCLPSTCSKVGGLYCSVLEILTAGLTLLQVPAADMGAAMRHHARPVHVKAKQQAACANLGNTHIAACLTLFFHKPQTLKEGKPPETQLSLLDICCQLTLEYNGRLCCELGHLLQAHVPVSGLVAVWLPLWGLEFLWLGDPLCDCHRHLPSSWHREHRHPDRGALHGFAHGCNLRRL